MFQRVFHDVLEVELKTPFPRLTWHEAMARYGSDKPDTRFGMEICEITEVVKHCGFSVFSQAAAQDKGCVAAIVAQGKAGSFTRKELDALTGRGEDIPGQGAGLDAGGGERRAQHLH